MTRFRRSALAAFAFTASLGATGPSPPGAAGGDGVSAQPICDEASVTASLQESGDPGTGLQRGRFRIVSRDPATAVTLLAPYFGSAHSDVPGTPRSVVFPSGIRYEGTQEGLVQELILDWFGDLELEVGAPGCRAVVVRCNFRGCGR